MDITPDTPAIEDKTGDERREALKSIIRDLHDGRSADDLTARFADLLSTADASEVAVVEQQLISEGMPVDEVMRLCDVHVRVFAEGLVRQRSVTTPPGHPVDTMRRENTAMRRALSTVRAAVARLDEDRSSRPGLGDLAAALDAMRPIHVHYTRKENQLFSFLDKHGLTGPSQVMWGLDDEIRAHLADAVAAVADTDADRALTSSTAFVQGAEDMIAKEEDVLLPMAMDTLTTREWIDMRAGESAIGYAYLDAVPAWPENPPRQAFFSLDRVVASGPEGRCDDVLPLDTGGLTAEQINLLLRTLKVDLNFVDENDEVRFYSEGERIFPRSPGVIGRKVQQCHPPSSVHKVQEILDAFRAGEKDVADFWIQLHGRFLHIRYLAMRDDQGTYRGTLEAVQDVTDIRALQGERRLVDW